MADHQQGRQQRPDQKKPEPQQRAVVEYEPPRIMYDEKVLRRYGLTKRNWLTLINAVFPSAKTIDGVCLALDYCMKRQLDIFARPVHIVPIYDSKKRTHVETVWLGIAALRTIAFRTGLYAGCEPTVFGDDIEGVFEDDVETWTGPAGKRSKTMKRVKLSVRYPAWAQITVNRKDPKTGEIFAYPGPRVYWLAGYGRMGNTDIPNDRWLRAPSEMLEKQAEAAALRKAFPEEVGDWETDDELATRHTGPTIEGTATETTDDMTFSDKPSQAWFRDDDEPDDGEGGPDAGAPQTAQDARGNVDPSDRTSKGGNAAQPQQAWQADGNPPQEEDHLSPAQRFVEDVVRRFDAAETLNDLNKVYAVNRSNIEALEGEMRDTVDQAFAGRLEQVEKK